MAGNTVTTKLPPIAGGQRYGRLIAVERAGQDRNGNAVWHFMCDCGTHVQCPATSARTGNTKSCGCLQRDAVAKTGRSCKQHGLSRTPEHNLWTAMHQRCNEQESYINRGITVCERWQIFETFYADMGERPSPTYTIDRIDNDKGYSLENCRWATRPEQSRNTSRNINVTFDGRDMCLKDAAALAGIKYDTVKQRVRGYGWSIERALSTPPKR